MKNSYNENQSDYERYYNCLQEEYVLFYSFLPQIHSDLMIY